jgi:hypothetical protein
MTSFENCGRHGEDSACDECTMLSRMWFFPSYKLSFLLLLCAKSDIEENGSTPLMTIFSTAPLPISFRLSDFLIHMMRTIDFLKSD